jgi:HK97 gp10 family phage protein
MSLIQLTGSEIVIAQLLALPEELRKKVERDVVGEANKLLAGAIAANVPQDSGALKKSIGSVIRRYKSGKIIVGVVGPKSDYAGYVIQKRNSKKIFRKAKKGENHKGLRRPSKYAHLVNAGTANRTTQHGTNRGSVTANPFMKSSLESVKNQIQQILKKKLIVDSG